MLFPQDLWRALSVSLSLPVRPGFRVERAAQPRRCAVPGHGAAVVATLNEWLPRARS